MMTLEEAIKHCKDVALSCSNKECALEHFQLLKWLQEYSNILDKLGEQESIDPDILIQQRVDALADIVAEQKPAWSEEDEKTINNICHIIRQYDKISKRENKPCWYIGDCLLWMQNIKDRVQPKQEWSEEDEKCIRLSTDIIDSALRAGFCVQLDRDRCVDWLKSLRLQKQWKPSEEQMKALHDLNLTGGISYAGQGQELINLYNNLYTIWKEKEVFK